MNTSMVGCKNREGRSTRHVFKTCGTAWLVLLIGFGGIGSNARAQPSDNEESGAQVLTRGPVHEAFAGIVAYDPEPGVEVTQAPPELIEEVPPEERPEGDNVAWIPGYWAWDDERSDFLWISGTWRALPPGREWMAGYWGQTSQGYQWISGYWADASATETTYLPAPPATVEAGPNIAAPSEDYGWTPGCWLWYQGRYAWRPGYWAQGRADWDWTPAHYVWTPRGYIFVEGFWDYSVERRGILFAPVYFESRVYSRRGYHYSPTIVINLGVFSDHLFLRPRYHHYYFGDYYGSNYQQGGIYASFSFQTSRHGYDPFYSRQRWVHRRDREWEHRAAESYQYRRDHESARPPRTWAAQTRIDSRAAESPQHRMLVATPIDQLAKRKDSPVRFQPVAREERQQLNQRGQEVQKSRNQRRALEAKAGDSTARNPGGVSEPAKVPMPRSPIVARPVDQMGKNQPPPKAQKPPGPNLRSQPAESPRRQPNADRGKSQPPPRQSEAERKSTPQRSEAPPRAKQIQPESPRPDVPAPKAREKSPRKTKEPELKSSPESKRREQATAATATEDSPRNARDLDKKTQQDAEQRAKVSDLRAKEESQRNAQAQELKAQQESKRREQAAVAAEDSQRSARELAKKSQQDAEQRAKTSNVREQEESRQKAVEPERNTRRDSVKPDKKAPVVEKREAANPSRKDGRKDDRRKPPAPEETTEP